jgi:NAD(P)-dependent dehydrogenase (short-subunit alcohol dehydrogenase family)
MNPLSMEGRTVLVTGASSGLGIGIARGIATQGARLILVARDASRLEAVRAELPGKGHIAESVDLSRSEAIAHWMKMRSGEWGPLHGLVHSAGTMPMRPLRVLNESDWTAALATNVIAASALVKGFRQPGVNAGGGSVVFLSSVTGLRGQPSQSAYSATKGALMAMARSLAVELARERIRVNCVAPAVVETGMSNRIKSNVTPEQWAAIVASHPLGLGTPEDVAHAVLFLLAETGRWITGSTLVVDGGYTA